MSKEIIKENVVEAPTLFVGVGGTGSKIVKGVAEMCGPTEVQNINFVCLDTNVNDLSSVKKSKASIRYVQTSNTQTVGSYLDYDEDARKNWFPKNAVMYDKTVSEGAGQVRAISRLALNATIKTGAIKALHDAIDDLFKKSGKDLKQALRVVVVSTASGGTGSGIILPLCMYIRDYVNSQYPNKALIVRSLIMLPEALNSVITSNVEKESQRRNAYATIKELNAFMIKGSGFMDLEGQDLEKYRGLHIDFSVPGTDEMKSLSTLPCDFCFLMDGQDSEDAIMVSLDQYISQASRALYEQNIGPMQKKAFSVEDNIIKELAKPGNFGRNRFGGIGASAIKYPYEDIVEYIACDWAMDSIGGDGETAKWTKYDKVFQQKLREGRAKNLPIVELPTIGEVYVTTMDQATDSFSKDIRGKYLSDIDERLDKYISALETEMCDSVFSNHAIGGARNSANRLSKTIDYIGDPDKRGNASSNLRTLRSYEEAVRANARKTASSRAESIFRNDTKTINEKNGYMLETAIKNELNGIFHPNAIRYMLYRIATRFEQDIQSYAAEESDLLKTLKRFAKDADKPEDYDTKLTKSDKEASIDDFCNAEQEKVKFYQEAELKNYYNQLNGFFSKYFKTIEKLATTIAKLEAFKEGYEYVKELSANFERFFDTFEGKVAGLIRKQEEIVNSLQFKKGDSEYKICATEEILVEMAKSNKGCGKESTMLSSELNGMIFDAIKKNVAFEKEIKNMDVVENDLRVDIFDDIMFGHFVESVRNDCPQIDCNIIKAIALEARLVARAKQRTEGAGDGQVIDHMNQTDIERHILEVIGMGARLAAPGIEKLHNVEDRMISLCAYNKSLLDMREYRVRDLLPNAEATDTVSRYELHFFNALYNLTPDKLNKFAAANETETRDRNAGLYHKAYMEYSKNIGPDSTKDMMISTHIDKRWDSISVMPELDLDYQKKMVTRIHQAMIYGLLFKAITFRKISTAYAKKKVYKYENSDERYVDLVVSNGTLCDEFYEILDSLYISAAIVGDIEKITGKKHKRDEVKRSNYEQTQFAKALEEFQIDDLHEGTTSIFEIPMFYYNSLPNSMRYSGEIIAMVDAAIKTIQDELTRCESPVDVHPRLCMILVDQFNLLMENYKKFDKVNGNTAANDSEVIDIIYRRIKNVFSTTPEPDDYEAVLADMKSKIQA